MIDKLILATRNNDKILEINSLLSEFRDPIFTLYDFPKAPVVIENGRTLEENARKKAEVIAKFTGLPTVADDTGLEVEYLNGQPGVYSSRYSGENATYSENVRKLLRELEGIPREKRNADFRCVVAFNYNGEIRVVEGNCKGLICEVPRGKGGFGYDPVFFVPEYGCTFAEMDLELKNKISHRGQAFSAFKKLLELN